MDARDAQGCVVPDRLAQVFQGRQRLAHWCLRLKDLADELRGMCAETYCRDLQLKQVLGYLETARSAVMLAAPYGVCDCSPKERDCPKCGGWRWLSGARHSMNAP